MSLTKTSNLLMSIRGSEATRTKVEASNQAEIATLCPLMRKAVTLTSTVRALLSNSNNSSLTGNNLSLFKPSSRTNRGAIIKTHARLRASYVSASKRI